MIIVFFIFGSATCFAGEKSFEQQIKEHEVFAKSFGDSKLGSEGIYQQHLLPQEKDKEFIRKNKEKYEFLNEEEILNISKENFDSKVSKGELEDPNAINQKDLNQVSTTKSLRRDAVSKDKSKTTPNEYLDIAVKSEESKRKYKKDLEEKQIKDAINIIEDPGKTLKEKFGMDPDCIEEEGDLQESLNPVIKEYKVNEKSKETIEERKMCEESEPVVFQCERILNLNRAGTKEGNVEIEISPIDSRVKWEFNQPRLRFWTGTSRWLNVPHPAACDKVIFFVEFKIKDQTRLTKFSLDRLLFRDYALIKLNGNLIYHTLGGDRLVPSCGRYARCETMRYAPHGYTDCGRLRVNDKATQTANIGKDLRGFLREGWNRLEMEVMYAHVGQVEAIFSVEQERDIIWNNKWENKCEQGLKKIQ